MEEISFTCPHCNVNLQAEKEFAGQVIECPNCSAQVIVPAPESPDELNEPAPEPQVEEEKSADLPPPRKSGKQYIWGRFYICFSGILAVLMLIVTIGYLIWNGYRTAQIIKLKNLYPNPEKAAKLVQEQSKFLKKYDDTVNLLSTPYDGVSYFAQPLSVLPGVSDLFNEQLDSPESVNSSIQTLAKYQANILEMKTIFEEFFQKEIATMEKKFPERKRSSGKSVRRTSVPQRTKGITSSQTTMASFYTPNTVREKKNDIKKYREMLTLMRQDNSYRQLFAHISSLERFLAFVNANLLAENQTESFGGIKSNVSNPAVQRSQEKKSEQEEAVSRVKIYFIFALNAFGEDWELETISRQLEKALNDYEAELIKKEMERKSLWTTYCSVSAIQLLVILFFCFMIMVIADYLKAHFDMAEALRRRDE